MAAGDRSIISRNSRDKSLFKHLQETQDRMATGTNSTTIGEAAEKPMDDVRIKILRSVREALVKDMDPLLVLLKMAHADVFSIKDEEEIKGKKTRWDQCDTLLEILPKRGAKAYDVFKEALKGDGHQHLANLLLNVETGKYFS